MNIKKSLLVAGAVTSVGLASLTGVHAVSAATDANGDSLVSKIAQKFNLNKSDVQAVFDENKTERDAERQAEMSDQLQQAVDDGDITAEQKTLIENKLKELQSARQTEHDALDAWVKEQGIDVEYLMMGGGPNDSSSDSSDRLQTAVDAGKITAEQKTAIEAKQAEMKEQRDTERTALEKWATDNNISQKYLMMGSGHGDMGGPGKAL
jgi:membrane-associated HD superfamily phosphohydrolase